MPDLTIKSIRIGGIKLNRDDKGAVGIEYATYALISNRDTVLAEQTIGDGYGKNMKLQPSVETSRALLAFMDAYQKDVETQLGFTE